MIILSQMILKFYHWFFPFFPFVCEQNILSIYICEYIQRVQYVIATMNVQLSPATIWLRFCILCFVLLSANVNLDSYKHFLSRLYVAFIRE